MDDAHQAAEALVEEALEALRREDTAHALRATDDALELDPDLARAHHVRSIALEALKRIPEARTAAERSVALDPSGPGIHAHLGDLWVDDDPARAEGHYRESVRRDSWERPAPARARVLNNLGVALEAQRKRREAALAYKTAHALDPTLKEARQNTRSAIRGLVKGAALLVAVNALVKAAKAGRHASKLEALKPYSGWMLGATVVLLAASWGIWLWRRTAGMNRLAAEEPELYALHQRLVEEEKAHG
jgi:tetratricopeptide (TPR) repeat protein